MNVRTLSKPSFPTLPYHFTPSTTQTNPTFSLPANILPHPSPQHNDAYARCPRLVPRHRTLLAPRSRSGQGDGRGGFERDGTVSRRSGSGFPREGEKQCAGLGVRGGGSGMGMGGVEDAGGGEVSQREKVWLICLSLRFVVLY